MVYCINDCVSYDNKKAIILFVNKINKKCTIYIPSMPSRILKYKIVNPRQLKKIEPFEYRQYEHYTYYYSKNEVEDKLATRTIKFLQLLLEYESLNETIINNDNQLDIHDREVLVDKIHKEIVESIMYRKDYEFLEGKFIEPNMEIVETTLLDIVFTFIHIPEELRIKIFKMILDYGVCGTDSIPPRRSYKYGINLFTGVIKTFKHSFNLKKVLKMVIDYGNDIETSFWNLDKMYIDKIVSKDLRDDLIITFLDKRTECIICNDSLISYKVNCCVTADSSNTLCMGCHTRLYNDYSKCPFCRGYLGNLVSPKLQRNYETIMEPV